MAILMDYLKRAVESQASDIFIVAGAPVSEKLEGQIVPMDDVKILPPQSRVLLGEIYTMASRSMDEFLQTGDDDFSFSVPGLARFRVNTYMQRGSMAAVIRVVSFDIPHYGILGIPEEVMGLAEASHGMILVTGTAGSGKSTTQACIVDRINRTRRCHIITLEDPIEFLHRNQKSIVRQREIAVDTSDYLSALRACLRQAPDVIQLGEMRDLETIRTAMTAAETGHLLFGTMHTRGTVNSIDRVVDAFPANQQDQIRLQLSTVLRTVISQQLVPDVDGNMIPAFEIMHVNSAIRNMIRENRGPQIDMAISAGGSEGMISMDQSLMKLYREGKITRETALERADNPEQMGRRLQQQ